MDDQLNNAPCGFLSITEDHRITAVNQTLLHLTGYGQENFVGEKLGNFLVGVSRAFFQIYFTPLIKLNGSVEEMYLSLRSQQEPGQLPVLLNAMLHRYQDANVIDCILMPMRRRMEYERQISAAEKQANTANENLKSVNNELSAKMRQLADLYTWMESVPLLSDQHLQNIHELAIPVYVYSVADRESLLHGQGLLSEWDKEEFCIGDTWFDRNKYIFFMTPK